MAGPTLPREKTPLDGPGPRGYPDCYYTSRINNSTFRYARFVKKLRQTEDEQRKGKENNLKELRDQQISDFFNRCDRRSLINNVARRVDLCMQSYQHDLEEKKKRLTAMYEHEETENIRKVVVQAQAAAEEIWQEKLARLQYLLEKRRLEHEKKYKDIPLSKCVHVTPCLVSLRNKEAQEFQLYQMREKEAMKMQEKEFDKMWYELGMKESDALAARMEIDAIERYRRDMDCKQHSDMILKQREEQRKIDRENLKKEQLAMKEKFEADMMKEAEEEAARLAKRIETGLDRKQTVADREAMLAKQAETDKLTKEVWDSLAGQGMAEDQAKLDLRRRKEQELDECNRKMIELRKQIESISIKDNQSDEIAKEQQRAIDLKRCDMILKTQKANVESRKAMMDQIADRAKAREDLQKKLAIEDEYFKQLQKQLNQLVEHKNLEEAKDRKRHQQDLLKQIEYNRLLKERALKEELEQRKKAVKAAEDYSNEIATMLCRDSFSDEVHPFLRQMKGLKMRPTCPCSKPNWCKT